MSRFQRDDVTLVLIDNTQIRGVVVFELEQVLIFQTLDKDMILVSKSHLKEIRKQ